MTVTVRMGQRLVLMEQLNECASNARWLRQPASGEDRETGPTRATYQLTWCTLCLWLSNDSLAI